jgi:hypothetical protein
MKAPTLILCVAGLLLSTGSGRAASVTGQARVVQATTFDTDGASRTTVLSDTGTLNDEVDARDASASAGDVPSLLASGVLHATTIAVPDQVASEASIADLVITVGGMRIGADLVMARARAAARSSDTSTAAIEGLTINGVPVEVTGAANQAVQLPGGRIVLNERQNSSNTVTAMHLVLDGVADLAIASATAKLH